MNTAGHRQHSDDIGTEASEIWRRLADARSTLAALEPGHFLRGTAAWIREGFSEPLMRTIAGARDALGALDTLAGDDDELGGLCFIGRAEISEARRSLGQVELGREDLLIAAEAARERVIRVLDAVLAHDGQPAVLEPVREGRNAARIRAVYARLARRIQAAEALTQVDAAIEALTDALTEAVSDDAWALVRMSDRFVVERLRRRSLSWGGPQAEDRDGRRLVSDAAASMSLIARIGLRPALVEHDVRTARQALELLESARTSTNARQSLVRALEELEGRDEALDGLAASYARGSAVGWRVKAALESLIEQLTAPPGF